MPGQTPVWALPYPYLTDEGDGPDGFLDLANRLEQLLTDLDARLDKLEVPTVASAGVTAASGFQVIAERLTKTGSAVTLDVTVRRTGSAITAGGSGDITNVTMFTVPSGYRPTSGRYGGLQVGYKGTLSIGAVDSAGVGQFTSTVPNGVWNTGVDRAWIGAWSTT